MTYGHLGRSGLLVSRIGLGTMNFGYTVDESSSFAVMTAARLPELRKVPRRQRNDRHPAPGVVATSIVAWCLTEVLASCGGPVAA